jgi:hypothetical protein
MAVRFFFHIIGSRSTFTDEEGQNFASVNDAKTYAAVIVSELGADGGAYNGFVVSVVDGRGAEVARLPVPCNPG